MMQMTSLVTVYYRSRVTGVVREFQALDLPELYEKLDKLPGVSLIDGRRIRPRVRSVKKLEPTTK